MMDKHLIAALYIISGLTTLVFMTICAKAILIVNKMTGGVGWTYWHELPVFVWLVPVVLIAIGVYRVMK